MAKKIAILVSGTGSNMQAIIAACQSGILAAQVELVISNKKNALALAKAQQANISTLVIEHQNFASREAFDQALLAELNKHALDLICLAGFMRILSKEFLANLAAPIINIHPSLLPKYKGAHAIEDAFAAGEQVTGCTVHYVIPEIDAGEIIEQQQLEILPNDDLASLKQRLHQLEHQTYVAALKKILL